MTYAFGLSFGIFIYAGLATLLSFTSISAALSSTIGGWLALLAVLALAYAVVKQKINPTASRSRKTIIDHSILALANSAAVATTVVPLLLEQVAKKTDFGLYRWLFLPVAFVNLFLWPLGWHLVTSSAQKGA